MRAVPFAFCTLAIAAAGGLARGPGAAAAGPRWWDEASLQIEVHRHSFHRVTANAIGCQVRVRLYFEAPEAAYQEPASARNHYRFLAQLRFSGGHDFESDVFDNSEPGRRVIAFSYDTQGQRCWADEERSLRKVDVHACRGERCTPEPFE